MSVAFDPVGDFASVVDGTQAVTLTDREGTDQAIPTVLRRSISQREAAASKGQYTTQDVRWHLPQSAVELSLVPGCTITESDASELGDSEWTVLAVERATLGDRWACVCRNLVVTEGLDTLVAIQQSVAVKGASGAHQYVWEYIETDVRAKIQRMKADEQDAGGKHCLKREYVCFMRERLDLRSHHRIIDADGTAYRVVGYRDPERIDKLTEVDLVRWQGTAGGVA